MKEYIIPTVANLDWTKAEKQSIDQCTWSPNPAPAASVQALFVEGDALYFRLESAALPSRAENTEPDSAVWQDSCLECFLSFDGKNYVNLESNANGALRASLGTERHGRRFLKDMAIPMPKTQPKLLENGWEMVFVVPCAAVEAIWGVKPESGLSFTGNFYSCGDLTPSPHFASWNYIDTPAPDFHRPEFFGKLVIA